MVTSRQDDAVLAAHSGLVQFWWAVGLAAAGCLAFVLQRRIGFGISQALVSPAVVTNLGCWSVSTVADTDVGSLGRLSDGAASVPIPSY